MFNKIKTVSVPEYDGIATLYRHSCGMEVFHIKNKSEELCASFIFATPSEDNTGVAHILEHTVLGGSELYPVKDPFSEICLTSPNTFLNAMTFPDKTLYPFASPLKKDFDIIFDIYADAVFAPLLRKETFYQEGVRFCGDSIDGVVFNEMRGAFSAEDEFVSRYSFRNLFKGTPAEFEAGGDPEFIPDLTYEEYLNRYKKWYSPSNCRLFLYGDMDVSEYLSKIEERYLTEERLCKTSGNHFELLSSAYMKPNAQPEYITEYCPSKDASSVMVNWLTTESSDPFEILTLSILTDILLGNPGAPLYKAVIDSGLGEDLNTCSGMESDVPVLTFSVGFTGAKKNHEKQIENFILATLEKLATEGIDMEQQKACLKRQKFKLQEIPGGEYPYGILVGLRASRFWLRGCDPIEGINNREVFKRLEEEFKKGHFFENWILKNLVKNPRRNLLTVKEDPDYETNIQKKLDEKYRVLRTKHATVLTQEKQSFENFVNTDDSEESLKKIPRISKADLPDNIPKFALESFEKNGVEFRYMKTFTRGITYLNCAFDTSSLSIDELKLLVLMTRVLQMCGTKNHTYSEIGTLIKSCTGRFSIHNSSGTKHDGTPASYLVVRTSAMNADVTAALDLTREILLESDLSDLKRIEASITDLITDCESDYLDSANAFASFYSMSFLTPSGVVGDILNGTSGYLYIKSLENAGKTELESLSAKLIALRNKIVCKSNMIFNFCCDEADYGKIAEIITEKVDMYPLGEKGKISKIYSDVFKPDYSQKYLVVSSGPAYNSVSFEIPCKNEKELVCAALASGILNSGYLLESVRGKGGAYGVGCHVDLAEKIFLCYSYRDPNIEKTLQCYQDAFESEIKAKDIDYTVAAIIGKELRPYVPRAKNYEAFRRSLYGLTDGLYLERRKDILSITLDDLKEICAVLLKSIKTSSAKTTVCGKDMIKPDTPNVLYLPI